MTYLSRLILDPRNREVRHDLADCQRLHCRILSGFPQAPAGSSAREHFGVLHRLDIGDRGGRITLMVQAEVEPDWSNLPGGYLDQRVAGNLAAKQIDTAYQSLASGQTLIFRLRANPTKRVKAATPGEKGKRVELTREPDQLDWLRRKGEAGGFEVVAAHTADDCHQPAGVATAEAVPNVRAIDGGRQTGRRQDALLTLAAVLFEGQLRVTDPNRFRETLAHGLGSGKAYGFGLLSVAASPS